MVLSATVLNMLTMAMLHMLQVDVDAVDFGLVAFGFRYAKEFTLTNTCAIPMQYAWRVPKDSLDPVHKEFMVSAARFASDTLARCTDQCIKACTSWQTFWLVSRAGVALHLLF